MMALVFVDGCDSYSSSSDVIKKWGASGSSGWYAWSSTYGRFGAGGLRVNSAGTTFYTNVSSASTYILGFAFMPISLSTGLVAFFREGSTMHGHLSFNSPSNTLSYERGAYSTGVPLITTSALVPDTWYYVEVKVYVHDSAGTAEIRIDGVTNASGSGLDTRNGGTSGVIDQIGIGDGANTYNYCQLDDFYICDTTGSVNNDFLGDCRIETLRPTSDSSPLDFTSTGGSHYTEVDEAAYSAADYVSSSTSTDRDQFGMGDMTLTPVTIHGVAVNTVAKKTDAGTISIKNYIKSSTAEDLSSAYALNTTSLNKQHIAEVDPNTTSAWLKANVDAMETGVEIV